MCGWYSEKIRYFIRIFHDSPDPLFQSRRIFSYPYESTSRNIDGPLMDFSKYLRSTGVVVGMKNGTMKTSSWYRDQ